MQIYKGKIKSFSGSWGSGLGMLTVDDEKEGLKVVPCDNGATVRALESAFGDVIGDSHNVKSNPGFMDQAIYYCYDEFGLVLGSFIPEVEATEELIKEYESE